MEHPSGLILLLVWIFCSLPNSSASMKAFFIYQPHDIPSLRQHSIHSSGLTTQRPKSFKYEEDFPRPNGGFSPKTSIQSHFFYPKTNQILSAIYMDPAIMKSSMTAVSELLVCSGLGALATKKGILDKNAISALTKVVYNIFLPSLLLANVASTVAQDASAALFSIPLMACIQIFAGLLLSKLMLRVLNINPKSPSGRQMQINTAFGNSGVLPILFASTLFRNHPDPTILPRSIAYLSLFLMGWSPIFWTLGFSILTGGNKDEDSGPTSESDQAEGSEKVESLWEKLDRKTPDTVKRIFSPPIVGAFMGLIIGLCPPLQKLLLNYNSPLLPLYNALQTFAKSYSPTALLVLAGSLALKPEKDNPQEGPSMLTQVAAVSTSRFIIFPVIWSGLMWLVTKKFALVQIEPLVLFLMLLESCMPSAQNSVLMLNLIGDRDGATRMARFLFAIYMVASIPISIWLTVFMQQVHL